VGIVFITVGSVLFAAPMIIRSLAVIGAANLVIGIGIQLSGPAWGGTINTTLGLLLLYAWWNRRNRRHRGTSALGAKSRALREALAKRLQERSVPVLS
jgi:membrane protein implicated in regulation of membrane protease activity